MENFENIEYQLMNVEHDDQNTEYQLKEVIAESSTKNSKKKITSRNLDVESNCDISLTLPEIQSVMTGYTPELKDNVQKITLYNILSIWAQFKILQHLEKWDHIIAFKTKHQKKYLMVTISIDFNK
ncbi:hypothetical protein GLOIN_2v1770186 [Rhizophagus irregularis DAOM 181602=DAOM 197198]|uniref:Uncharacterized protein n=1 Tax=Rhizophagus irregularis (strain DAOM 181602 / DAOM 197198 / MUCL 43194) TaxID=747089 RepID=A0A2P4QD23_RHIID|nr:hypothetical protein GLOIN_2v1770186 [Rhizophagus irregularis DAOM 181602=DAOM 197198]POG75532.1 hypothetical protein GLOIN_2v1770186 [Rhizophagus irregularis DAOM 181602=DAOM 197198]|eukprot:XP_025182398.1 hypothetical protein GLOIN_2v1770186 [Rhizophagus irregularis DAOM 181602=DAOM 197198]